jgi:hypothetical protein
VELPVLDRTESSDDAREFEESRRVATLLATINSHWLPLARQEYETNHGNWRGPVKAEAIEDTSLITLNTSGDNLSEANVRLEHQVLAGLIVNAQNEQHRQRASMLEKQIASMDRVLETNAPGSVVAGQALETRAELEQKIATGEPAEIFSLAVSSPDGSSGMSLKLILVLAILIVLVPGIFAAFMAEFGSQVRQAVKEKDGTETRNS